MTKLVPTSSKAKITWIKTWYGSGFGYDAKCDCGWSTNFGLGTKSAITQEVWGHKYIDHDYVIQYKGASL